MRARLLIVPLLVAVSACSDYSTSPNGGSPSLEIADGRVTEFLSVANPDKLRAVAGGTTHDIGTDRGTG